MELGLITPVVTINHRVHNPWEVEGTIDDVVAIAQTADRLGYHHLTCSEHVAVPASVAGQRGSRYWDPLATLSFLAAHTTRLRLATHMLVLGYHHPLQIVKSFGTLDRLSGGRLIVGVGVGSLAPEFELLGADFDGRGPRADDAIRALRASFGEPMPSFRGTHFEFDGFVVDPLPMQAHLPIWVGGRTRRSLRRAVELGDAWVPFGVSVDQASAWLDQARSTAAWSSRRTVLDVVLAPEPPLDPMSDPGRVPEVMATYEAAGATMVNLRLVHQSAAQCCEQLEALAGLVRT